MYTFNVGDVVEFGRPNGEKTEGRVVRVNAASITIEQTEQRGVARVREAGTKWRVHPSLVKPLSKAKRSDAEIITALRNIEAGLSPENLFADGLRNRTVARRMESRLMSERAALVAELGREPSPRELWGY